MKRRPITPEDRREWANVLHLLVLNGLVQDSAFKNKSLAFHGGTSLHLSWHSPRFSEDLDFLVSRELASKLDKVITRAARRIQEGLVVIDPGFQLEINRRRGSREKLNHYAFKVSKPNIIGKVMVKLEMWKVESDYVERYETNFRTPLVKNDLIAHIRPEPLPAATLISAFCDKMVAFATRPHLKWRDIFDVWWLTTNAQTDIPPMPDIARRFIQHLSEYRTYEDLPPSSALDRFVAVLEQSHGPEQDRDLKNWLPQDLWDRLYPEQITAMTTAATSFATHLAAAVRDQGLDAHYHPDSPVATQQAIQEAFDGKSPGY